MAFLITKEAYNVLNNKLPDMVFSVSNDLEGFVDTYNDDYTWYRSDELESYGYIHENDLWETVDNDGEGLDRLLSKNNDMRLSKDTVSKLYNGEGELTKDERELIEAFLNE